MENTPDGAVLHLANDQIASSWVVSLFRGWTNLTTADHDIVYNLLRAGMFQPVVLSYGIRRDGVLFLDVGWDRVGRGVPGLCGGRWGSAGGVCGCGGGDGDVYAGGRGGADVFDTGGQRVWERDGDIGCCRTKRLCVPCTDGRDAGGGGDADE